MRNIVKIPLSLAVVGVIGLEANLTGMTSGEWRMIGSENGINITQLIGSYTDDAGSGCADSVLQSAWRYDNDADPAKGTYNWTVASCLLDVTGLGYTVATQADEFEGIWVHARNAGTSTIDELLTTPTTTTMTTYDGWNMLAVGSAGIADVTSSNYAIFNDTSNNVELYRYNSGTWEYYAPNGPQSSTNLTRFTSLNSYEGFWAYVTAAKDYATTAAGSSGSGSNQIDVDSNIHDTPGGTGVDDITLTLDADTLAANLLTFTPPTTSTTRWNVNAFTAEENVTKTSEHWYQYTASALLEANESAVGGSQISTATDSWILDDGIERIANEFDANNPGTSSDLSSANSRGLFDRLVEVAQNKSYIADSLKGDITSLFQLVEDLNATVRFTGNKITAADKLAEAYKDANAYYNGDGSTFTGVNSYTFFSNLSDYDGSNTTHVGALVDAYTYFQQSEDWWNKATTAYEAVETEVDRVKTQADAVKTAIDALVAGQDKDVIWTTSTPAQYKVEELNKTVTLQFSPNLQGITSDGSSITAELYFYDKDGNDLGTGPADDSGGNSGITISGSNDTCQAIIAELNTTGGVLNDSTYSEVVVTGYNCNANAFSEINITGVSGSGIAISGGSWTVNNGAAGDFDPYFGFINETNASYDLTTDDHNTSTALLTGQDVPGYRPGVAPIIQVGELTVTGSWMPGDELNITVGASDIGMSAGATYDANDTVQVEDPQPLTNFIDSNLSMIVLATDYVAGDTTTTNSNIALRLTAMIDSSETNLSATQGTGSSANVVTVTLSNDGGTNAGSLGDGVGPDDNVTFAGIEYALRARPNNYDISLLSSIADMVAVAAESLDGNYSAFVDGTTYYSLPRGDINATLASGAIQSFTDSASGSTNGTVYLDSTLGTYWNLSGVTPTTSTPAGADTECGSSFVHQMSSWRLPTPLEVIAMYDSANQQFAPALQTSTVSSSVITTNKTILTEGGSGEYYLVSTSGLTVTPTTGTASLASSTITTCVHDYSSAVRTFDDFYYTSRLASTTSGVTDDFFPNGQKLWTEGTLPQGHPSTTATTLTEAQAVCSNIAGGNLPTASELRSLYLYDLKGQYDTTNTGLSSVFGNAFQSSGYYWTSTDTDGDGNYDIIDPTATLSHTQMFGMESDGTTAYNVVCVQ